MDKFDFVFVNMPWAPPSEPSIALGILKECLARKNIRCKIVHAAPKLLKWLSYETYSRIADISGVNEFLFTAPIDAACDERQLSTLVELLNRQIFENNYTNSYSKYPSLESLTGLIMLLRDEIIPVYLEECARTILSYSPSLVGFSCMFDQTMASVALAKLLKDKDPSIPIVFGGYALEGTTGETVVRSFPWIDLIVQGEGEEIIVEIAESVLKNGSLAERPGKMIKTPNIDMETSPIPDYSDWFEDVRLLDEQDSIKINTRVLPVESSRGCWWGQVKHCVFCGIDEGTLKYRHKSAESTINMLRELRRRHGENYMYRFSDYIMPKAFYTELLPLLAKEYPKFHLISEIKANQTTERVQLFRKAGFYEVQPGIESFSTPVLAAMDKGVRGIDNVCLLKNGYTNKLSIVYNILYGLPSDSLDDYQFIIENIPRIYHLVPPVTRTRTIITRFAPLQMNPERFGINGKAKHDLCYDVLFSGRFLEHSSFNLDDYAYYFERNYPYKTELVRAYIQLVQQIDYWKKLHRERFVELSYLDLDNACVRITDTRFMSEDRYILKGLPAEVLLLADAAPIKIRNISKKLKESGAEVSQMEIDDSIALLNDKRLVWIENDLILGLPVHKKLADKYNAVDWSKSWPSIYA
jgi:ribosomal peptide maturation radical SAM protein 1